MDIIPDRLSLTNVEKKPSESFKEYGFRWREQAARVNPPMEEDEMVKYFLQALEPTYYGHLISSIGKSFNDVVKMGEMVEEGLKSSKIMSYSAIKATTQAIQNGTGSLLGKKKKDDVATVVFGPWHGQRGHDIEKCWHLKRAIQELINTNQIVFQSLNTPNINQNPLPTHVETHMIEIVHKDWEPKKSSKSVMMIRASESNLVKTPNSTKAKPLTVEGATEKSSSLNLKPPVLVVKGPSKDIGASPERSEVLPVVDAKAILWNNKQVIVSYKGKEIEEEVNATGGLTRSGRCFTPEELRKAKPFKDRQMPIKKSVTEKEAEEFLKKMKVQDYSILEQVLMKILNEAHVPDNITVNHLENIASKIFEVKRITFSDDKLPMEVEDDKGPWVYQTFETVSVEKIPEGKCILGPKLSSASVMGIVHPVRPNGNPGTFGLGFMPTEKDVKRVKNLKQKVWSHPKPVLHISKSFVKPGAEKPPTSSIPKPMVDVDEELIKRFQSLFDEVSMVEVGEGSSKAGFSFYVGYNDMTCMKNFQPSLKSQSNSEIIIQEVDYDDEIEYDEESTFEEIGKELKQFVEKRKPNMSETKTINLGDQDNVRETNISVHLEPQVKEKIIKTLFEYKDVFAWSYDDMPGLSTDLVVHRLPTDPEFPLVKQKLQKFKTDMSVKIKE
ncbi:uncharacterized protein [Nicotiana sylvestris]|uniref:uncharacterized protein n=1 Tax=Nicotiana sylvestris TaxID=4096 RepID=UPI00388C6D04